jgi:Rrf2 family protein
MFQISRRVDYAVRMMIELGMQPVGVFMPARRVAARTAVPKAFLHKITADLVQANLIQTQTGPSGGLALQKECSEINLLQIVEAIEGPICLNVCLIRPHECNRDRICPGHEVWGQLQMMIAAELQNTCLAALVREGKRLQKQPRAALFDFPYLYPTEEIAVTEQMITETA